MVFAACWLLWTAVQFSMLNNWGFNWYLSLIDALFSNLLLAGACIVITNILQVYRPNRHRYLYMLVLCGAITGLWSAIVSFGLGSILSQYPDYVQFIERSMPVRVDIAFLVTGCSAILALLWYNMQQQREIEERKSSAEKLAREAELYRLQQQLQPHFLFNSLNSISALAGTQPQQARRMIQQLSEFLRGTLRKDEHQWTTLNDEIQHLNLYLEIEKVRFSHRLKTEILTEENSLPKQLPAMLLQPVVENAIKFGLYDTTGDITITIQSMVVESYLLIIVQNPFDPATVSGSGTGFGLSSIRRRLYLLYARNDLVNTTTSGNTFSTTIKIPQLA